jgi:pimeloyl-ACP methyl ester carboxylesterase
VDWKVWRRRVKIVWVTAGLAFTAWIVWNMQAHGVPASARVSSATVTVTDRGGAMTFMPSGVAQEHTALVFIAGGMVDPDAYLPFVYGVADAGWPAALVRLPWRMASSEKANIEVWRRVNDVRASWGSARPVVIGGHSLGAAIASRFAYRYGTQMSGLLLVGTTHPKNDDLSSLTIPVLKISGTRDCVADLSASQALTSKLPPQTVWTTIVGANHAQFGYYGTQLGDCGATITRGEQQRQLLEEVLRWMRLPAPDSQITADR